jgi:hypothetical protein
VLLRDSTDEKEGLTLLALAVFSLSGGVPLTPQITAETSDLTDLAKWFVSGARFAVIFLNLLAF